MAMTPERSHPLHNFNLPPRLRWGTQRHLRCKKPEEEIDNRSNGTEAIGEKLMMDSKLKIDKISNEKEAPSPSPDVGVVEGCDSESLTKPWNLRVRRSSLAEGGVRVVERRNKKVRVFEEENVVKKLRVRLDSDEIVNDFAAMGVAKLPRRPKKRRPRAIQKRLDNLFPGFGLNEVNMEMYAVREAPE